MKKVSKYVYFCMGIILSTFAVPNATMFAEEGEPVEEKAPPKEEIEKTQTALESGKPEEIDQEKPISVKFSIADALEKPSIMRRLFDKLTGNVFAEVAPGQVDATADGIKKFYQDNAVVSSERQKAILDWISDLFKLTVRLPARQIDAMSRLVITGFSKIAPESAAEDLEAARKNITSIIDSITERSLPVRLMDKIIDQAISLHKSALNAGNQALANTMAWVHTALVRSLSDEDFEKLSEEQLLDMSKLIEYTLKNKINGANEALARFTNGLASVIAKQGTQTSRALRTTFQSAVEAIGELTRGGRKMTPEEASAMLLPDMTKETMVRTINEDPTLTEHIVSEGIRKAIVDQLAEIAETLIKRPKTVERSSREAWDRFKEALKVDEALLQRRRDIGIQEVESMVRNGLVDTQTAQRYKKSIDSALEIAKMQLRTAYIVAAPRSG